MKILVTGSGKSGSWKIRGEQLGAAMGATVLPSPQKMRGYDVCVLVKRPANDIINMAHANRVPLVYDVVDAWQQIVGTEETKKPCIEWLQRRIVLTRPAGLVAASQRMAADFREVTDVPVVALPHHARPGLTRNPIRETIKKVGYEGGEQYLGKWRAFLTEECKRRGWEFVINPPSLADLDIVIAVRDQTGYAPRMWKSNVKLANAQGSGTPCVLNNEAGYRETSCGAERWADTEAEMCEQFDYLTPHAVRAEVADRLYAARINIEIVAQAYREWLSKLKS
jgi:hypothetical protein